jgi:hypothetical protein
MIIIEEIKKKYLIPSELKIAICNAEEIKDMVILLEQQQQQLKEAYKELHIANDMIRDLKAKNRYQKYLQLEEHNLDLDKKLREANQKIESLLVVQSAYEAYKKAH